MKIEKINDILKSLPVGSSKWELDTVVYHDRYTNPDTLSKFLSRIQQLTDAKDSLSKSESKELSYLLELLEEMDEEDIEDLSDQSDDLAREVFIENLAKVSAIEILTNGKLGFDTMTTACKLSPNDFILCAKRTQDLINAIHSLVIKGETLSKDVAGA
jgi:hypothetical protein